MAITYKNRIESSLAVFLLCNPPDQFLQLWFESVEPPHDGQGCIACHLYLLNCQRFDS